MDGSAVQDHGMIAALGKALLSTRPSTAKLRRRGSGLATSAAVQGVIAAIEGMLAERFGVAARVASRS